MQPAWIDTHAHFSHVNEDRLLVDTAAEAGVGRIVAVGGSDALNTAALSLAEAFPEKVFPAFGYDREAARMLSPEMARDRLGILLNLPQKPVAIGEIGLDLHHLPESSADEQCALFAEMMRIADESRLPFILHTREADDPTLATLDAVPTRLHDAARRGVAHSFTGTKEMARALLDRGLYISFSGIVTFRNADQLREVAAYVPEDRLLVETDTPYLTPVPLRGRSNCPAYVVHVGECLARVRGVPVEEIARATTENACRLFALPPL